MADASTATVTVEVCFAQPAEVFLVTLSLPAPATLAQAVASSGVQQRYPTLDLTAAKMGVWGKLRSADALLRDGDRVEIYRPLQADPKESRRRRARHKELAR